MSCSSHLTIQRLLVAIVAIAIFLYSSSQVEAQFGFRQPSVGGVKIDTDGVVSNPQVGELKQLQAAWQKGLQQVPADLEKWTDLRFVSLKQLESEIASARAAGKPLPDSVRYLAGLQRVRYVLIYPEQQDIVLAGPAEGWKIDALGSVVGVTSGRPVLTLDDLMVALRVAESSNTKRHQLLDRSNAGRSAADAEQKISRQLSSQPQVAGRQMEEAVGMQTITVTGIPATSHFARAIVAADFRMKRLAMNFEPAPIDGMPSFLAMLKRGRDRRTVP